MVTIFYKIWNKIEDILWTCYRAYLVVWHFPRSVKWFCQRGYRGWADCDWWDTDEYLADVICEMLIKLRQNYDGCPVDLSVQDKDGKSNCDLWGIELDKMIEGFRAAKLIKNGDYFGHFGNEKLTVEEISEKYKELEARLKIGGESFIKYFNHLWD